MGAPTSLLAGLIVASVAIFWAYEGWYSLPFNAAELKRPERDLPRGLIWGMLILVGTYTAVNAAYLHVVPLDEMRAMSSEPEVPKTVIARAFGAGAGDWLAILICISTLGAANPALLSNPRCFYAMARDGMAFPALMRVHAVYGTPTVAIWAQALWASLLVVVLKTFRDITEYVVFAGLIFYGLAVAAVYAPAAAPPRRAAAVPLLRLSADARDLHRRGRVRRRLHAGRPAHADQRALRDRASWSSARSSTSRPRLHRGVVRPSSIASASAERGLESPRHAASGSLDGERRANRRRASTHAQGLLRLVGGRRRLRHARGLVGPRLLQPLGAARRPHRGARLLGGGGVGNHGALLPGERRRRSRRGAAARALGPAVVVAGGALVSAAGLLLFGQVQSMAGLYLAYLVFGVGFACNSLLPGTTLVTRWFSRRRGVALALATTGLSTGGVLITPLSARLVASRGHRRRRALARGAPI